ncbi:cytochrome P450 [Actinokineospora enzanensis]|uniref:cytochrome P450 n=1 Tax=Actinokineospora enzanensis TaxID=155975 RepID=UPI0003607BD1|nr:cytochrome P450 [Actinokineospora enzanensis]
MSAEAVSGCPFGFGAESPGVDLFGPEYQADAGASLAECREHRPVYRDGTTGYWVVTRYRDIRSVFRAPEIFSAANAMDPIRPPGRPALRALVRHRFTGGPVIANEDEPVHGRRRRRLARPFTRNRVALLEESVRELVVSRIERFSRRGEADLVGELFWETAALVALLFIGVPRGQLSEVASLSTSQAVFNWGLPTEDEQVESCEVMGRFWAYAQTMVRELKECPREDGGWIAHAVKAQGRSPELFSDTYLQSLVLNGATAAHETTAAGAANAVWSLLENPSAWAAVCADRRLIPGAVEECLRYRPSVVAWRRKATRTSTVGGTSIPEGAPLLLVTASANRDPSVFPEPDTFDIARRGARRHLTFGDGNHACLGATLARLQLRVFLEELSTRLPGMRLVPGQDFAHPANTSFHGPERLLVRWPL